MEDGAARPDARRMMGQAGVAKSGFCLSIWVCVLLVAIVAVIAWAVASGQIEGVDRSLIYAAQGLPDRAASAITRAGDTEWRFAVAALIALALLFARDRAGAMFLIGAVAGGAGFNTQLKQGFARPRPDLLPHLDMVHSSSFPSGHSAGALVLGFALALVAVRHGAGRVMAFALAGGFAVLVGVSRVVLAVHWPSDVVAGWSAGALWLIGCAMIFAQATGSPVTASFRPMRRPAR